MLVGGEGQGRLHGAGAPDGRHWRGREGRPPCLSPALLEQWPAADTRGRSWLIQEL